MMLLVDIGENFIAAATTATAGDAIDLIFAIVFTIACGAANVVVAAVAIAVTIAIAIAITIAADGVIDQYVVVRGSWGNPPLPIILLIGFIQLSLLSV